MYKNLNNQNDTEELNYLTVSSEPSPISWTLGNKFLPFEEGQEVPSEPPSFNQEENYKMKSGKAPVVSKIIPE